MLLKIFFLIPSWFFNVFIKKRPPYRGHIFDQQSQALISLQPSIDLTTIPDNEISDIRKLITENRIKNKLSCLLYTSPSPRDGLLSRMPSSA